MVIRPGYLSPNPVVAGLSKVNSVDNIFCCPAMSIQPEQQMDHGEQAYRFTPGKVKPDPIKLK
jgi:hypothetical protein